MQKRVGVNRGLPSRSHTRATLPTQTLTNGEKQPGEASAHFLGF